MPDLRVLMVAAECVPFAKFGGLADVLGALPVALEKLRAWRKGFTFSKAVRFVVLSARCGGLLKISNGVR